MPIGRLKTAEVVTKNIIISTFISSPSRWTNPKGAKIWLHCNPLYKHRTFYLEATELNYDSDWNWFMVAWEKFFKLDTKSFAHIHHTHKAKISNAVSCFGITEGFYALVDGIIWYNNIKTLIDGKKDN